MNLIRITSPYFCAGISYENGRTVRIAPIIKYMKNWPFERIRAYCARKHWTIEVINR